MATVDEFIERYGISNVYACAVAACQAMAYDVADRLQVYPPATASNRPGRFDDEGHPLGYYERNRGWWNPIVRAYNLKSFGNFGKAKVVIRASKTQRKTGTVAGYKLRATSEMLGKKWIVRRTNNGAILTNSASYARIVQDKTKQPRIHEMNNWLTIQDAIRDANSENVGGIAFMQALEKRG